MNNVTRLVPRGEDADDVWLQVIAPKVLGVSAHVSDGEEPSTSWTIEYAPEPDEPHGARFIVATLEVTIPEAIVVVDIGAVVLGDDFGLIDESMHELYAGLLADAMSLDVVYDFAAITARGLLGTIGDGSGVDLPPVSPVPVIRPMDDDDEVEVS